jgi:hypothetical protein
MNRGGLSLGRTAAVFVGDARDLPVLCHHCLTNLTASSMLRQDAFRSQFRPIAVGGCELHKLLAVDFPLAASPAGSAAAAAPASP